MDLRCFIAIELPPELKESIHGLTGGLRSSGARAKWVLAENLHLTLKFLGNTPEEMIDEVKEGMARASAGHDAVTLVFRGAGAFPDIRRPRVVWVGVEDSGVLSALQRDMEEAMAALGFAPDGRDYSPHLTIGRIKSQGGLMRLRGELEALGDTVFGTARVSGVSLMKSELGPAGARYERLLGVGLAG
jgi:2'-5' RNA ligase